MEESKRMQSVKEGEDLDLEVRDLEVTFLVGEKKISRFEFRKAGNTEPKDAEIVFTKQDADSRAVDVAGGGFGLLRAV